MRYGSLFSGIGLMDLGLENVGFKAAWQCENDKQASKVLEYHWPEVPNFGDITKVDWSEVEPVDALVGGFPCQPFSSAGMRKGSSDDRWMWPEFFRAIRVLRPKFVVLENVSALLRSPEWGTILGDLANAGYDAKWRVLRASDVGAPHRRERVFAVAYSHSTPSGRTSRKILGSQTLRENGSEKSYGDGLGDGCQVVTYSHSKKRSLRQWKEQNAQRGNSQPLFGPKCEGSQRAVGITPEARADPAEVNWGPYAAAIRKWEQLTRRCPAPVDRDGRLSPRFVEWMMGAPHGWTDVVSRTAAIRGLGNGVVVQVAELIGRWALDGET